MDGAGWPLTVLQAVEGDPPRPRVRRDHDVRAPDAGQGPRPRPGGRRPAVGGLAVAAAAGGHRGGAGFSMRGALNHAALMSYAAQAGGAPIAAAAARVGGRPRLRAARVRPHRRRAVQPSSTADAGHRPGPRGAFRAVRELHTDRLAHRALTAEELVRDDRGRVWLTGIDNGVVAATDVQERDRRRRAAVHARAARRRRNGRWPPGAQVLGAAAADARAAGACSRSRCRRTRGGRCGAQEAARRAARRPDASCSRAATSSSSSTCAGSRPAPSSRWSWARSPRTC